ncbi:Uncharacterised protein [Mycobacteroides abscessus subsp. bolletii]|nr:Uncharacterised protein [Mycobacteroides abscessus subsp. bolletii]SKS05256.1 Uncharacterised protein [Mycobacteroides abscessus subsp. abscessus]SHW62913.1 Uncharacterised protein [Mycobacteroides abscessus subsp. bolletii]SHW90920.1 Uncharacterised protein [Mycobacteroides abscessus subsp. bolletii]SHX34394.1 Uncharacterised protein [Mycobacteroides abscessus subsp. bolletii]
MLNRLEDKLAKAVETGICTAVYRILDERIPKNLLDLLPTKGSEKPENEKPVFDLFGLFDIFKSFDK